jgi:glycosyltransferase involved in cell wall biosynthesis
MNIALDATDSLEGKPSGVGVYCARIIHEIAERAPTDHFHLGYRFRRFFPVLGTPLPASNCSRFLLEESAWWLSPRRAALFHGLNQRLPGIRFRGMVTTFHDLFMMTAEYSTPEFRERFTALSRSAAERSDHIIAVSQFTADQVVELLGYPRDRITVVHHGVDPSPAAPLSKSEYLEKRFGVTGPFLLHVGAIQRRKNIERLGRF